MESLKNSTPLKEIFALEIDIYFLLSSLLSIWLPCHTGLNHAWPTAFVGLILVVL